MVNQIDKDINTIANWLLNQEFLKDEILWFLQERYTSGKNHIRDDYDGVFESLEEK